MIKFSENPTATLTDADNLNLTQGRRMATVLAKNIPGYNQLTNINDKHPMMLVIDEAGDLSWEDVACIEEVALSNTDIPEKTLRFSFGNLGYDPTQDTRAVGAHEGTWKKLATKYANIWDYSVSGESMASEFGAPNNNVTGMFDDWVNNPTKVLAVNFTGITDASRVLLGNFGIVSLPVEMDLSPLETFYLGIAKLPYCTQYPRVLDYSGISNNQDLNGAFQLACAMKHAPTIIFPTTGENNIQLSSLYMGCYSLEEIDMDLTGVTLINNWCQGCTGLTKVTLHNTSTITSVAGAFQTCMSLTECPEIDSAITRAEQVFSSRYRGHEPIITSRGEEWKCPVFRYPSSVVEYGVMQIPEFPNYNFSSTSNLKDAFSGNIALKHIPELYMPSATDVSRIFQGCRNVETGMLRAYSYLKTISGLSSSAKHADAFTDCGVDTVSGRLDRQYIPQSWGGDGPEV